MMKKYIGDKKKIILIILIIALLACGLVAARYIFMEMSTEVIEAEGFYFVSDVLDVDDRREKPLYGWDAGKDYSVEFKINNFKDVFHVSQQAITYQLDGYKLKENGEEDNENPVTIVDITNSADEKQINNDTSRTLSVEEKTHKIRVKIPAGFFETGTKTPKILVRAKSTSPYSKTLIGVFSLHKERPNTHIETRETKNYTDLLVGIIQPGSYTITCPEGLLPDVTQKELETFNQNERTFTIEVTGESDFRFRFFKTDTQATSKFTIAKNLENR